VRILQFNNYADPVGGAEVYALALTRELGRRGHEVGLFGTSPDREVDEPHLRVVRRPRYDAAVLAEEPAVRAALLRFAGAVRPELVHVHNVYSLGLDTLVALGTLGVPIVQTVHDFSLLCPNAWCVRGDGTNCAGGAGAQCFAHGCDKNYPFDPEVALHTLAKQRALRERVDLTLCPSVRLCELMRAHGARDVRRLPYFIEPIPVPLDGAAQRAEHELVFLGRLEPEKGVDTLLAAMPAILAGEPRTRLTIVGGGSLAEPLERRARELALGDAVRFQRQLPRAELGRFYATATACVLPSIWTENSPLVAYECLSAGLPMIASRIGGIPDLVEDGECGFTFRPRDAADLAQQALRLLRLSGTERARLSAAMRERSRAFRVDEHMAQLEPLYADLVRRSATAPRRELDDDWAALLQRIGGETRRLQRLAADQEGYIRHLEGELQRRPSLADGVPAPAATHAPAPDPGLLRRLARALFPVRPAG